MLDEIRKHSKRFHLLAADVASPPTGSSCLAGCRQSQLGRLDVLVNNAGIAPRVRADVLDAGEESFDEVISTNLRGPYFLTQKRSRLDDPATRERSLSADDQSSISVRYPPRLPA